MSNVAQTLVTDSGYFCTTYSGEESAMSKDTWQDLAKAASAEHDSNKLMRLVEQLLGTLDEENEERSPKQNAG